MKKIFMFYTIKGIFTITERKNIILEEKYSKELKSITEIENHDEYGIAKFYPDDDFKKMIGKFIEIRNSASHAGVQWNGGEKIFLYLKILVYYSVLERAGFSVKEISMMLSWLYGWQF